MKHLIKIHRVIIPVFLVLFNMSCAQDQRIRLIVRGDDMGMAQAVNDACIRSYREGVMTAVEVMVPGPWFPDAVRLLNENPELDVGIHLTLTSEWSHVKSRPLTQGRSFVDENGYFLPMVWSVEGYEGRSLMDWTLDMNEVETELRAQIEQAQRLIPHITHITDHMGFSGLNKELGALFKRLGREYGLDIFPEETGTQKITYQFDETTQNKKEAFIKMLEGLTPGDYYFLDHPGLDTPELRGFSHVGYENVAEDRASVTMLFLSEEVKKTIAAKNIRLINYADLRK